MSTLEQRALGWEHLVLKDHVFRCWWHTKRMDDDHPPHVWSIHKSLTNALRANGNLARNWKCEADCDAQETPATGIWTLTYGKKVCLTLTVDYIPKDTPGIVVEIKPVGHATGEPGRIEEVYRFLRGRGIRI